VFKKNPANRSVLLAPIEFTGFTGVLAPQQRDALVADAIDDVPRTAPAVVVDLRARPFQVSMMKKQLETPQDLLRTLANERNDVLRA
jgi:hypothetical protein